MRYGDLLGPRTVFTSRPPEAPAPLVTVVMPTYCRHSEGMLERCLQSVLQQTFGDFEFIVMDDGSTDGTEQVLQQTALRDPRLVHVRLERNSGLPGVLINEAVRMGRGQFIAYMFDDNEWFPGALENLLHTARSSQADLIHGKAIVVQANGQRVEFGGVPSGYESLAVFNTIPNGAVLIRRSFVDQFGLYDPHYVIGRLYDWELWLRAWKMGARFAYVDEFITTEYGPTSSTSLGNAVKLNFPISAAYLQDEARGVANAARLKPDTIDDYDILNPETVLPYVRSLAEWDAFEETVFQPLLRRHPEYEYLPPLRHNRRFDRQFMPYQLNPVYEIFNDRKRTILISNRATLLANDLRQALQADGRRIVFLAPQWSAGLYNVEDLDEIIILDSSINWVLDAALEKIDLQKPIIFIQQADVPQPIADPYVSLQHAWHSALNIQQSLVAFPGIPLDKKVEVYRQELRAYAQLTLSSQPQAGDITLEYLPNAIQPLPAGPAAERNLYVGDFSTTSEATRESIHRLAQQGWCIWLFPWSHLPQGWEEFASIQLITDSLPACVQKQPAATWSAVPEVARLHAGFDHSCLLEDLLRQGGRWVDFAFALQQPDDLQLEEARQKMLEDHERLSISLCPDARWRQWRNLVDGAAFCHRVLRQRGKDYNHQTVGQIFINSQAIGGSEAVGMLIAWAFNRIGIHCRLAAPAHVNVHAGGLETINHWLLERGLEPASTAEYGMVNYALYNQHVDTSQLENLAEPLKDWLSKEDPDWLLASAIIPEPAVAAAPDQICFMSMFSPWDYPLHRLPFLRDFVDGSFSDTAWAASLWSAWLQPPFGVVRSLVEPDRFQQFNRELAEEPIQIAVIGALQPRKRQREAILAVRKLLQKGYSLEVNFYGYEFAGFTEYIEGLRTLAQEPDLAGHIHIHGFVENMDDILANNHLVFSASGDESLPNSLLQAMAAGLIPVAAPAGGIAEAIEDGVTGFLCAGFSINDLAAALERAILARPRWPQLASRARRWVADHCSEQVFVSDLLGMMLQAAEIWSAPGSNFFSGTPMMPEALQPVTDPEVSRKFLSLDEEERLRPGPQLNPAPLIFPLQAEKDGWCGVRVRFGSYFRQPAGSLLVEIRRKNSPHVLRSITVDLSRVHDNEWLELLFSPIRRSLGQNFEVNISAEITSGRLVVYEVLPDPLPVQLAVLRTGQVSRRYLKARLPLRRNGLAILPVYCREDAHD